MKREVLLKLFNLYPPYLGAGIRVKKTDKTNCVYEVSMRLSFYNNNYVGVHFGGSLYSMCDPFYMLILMEKLGKEYTVWDKAASIQFKRPGKGRVHATFSIPQERVDEIIDSLKTEEKVEPIFHVNVLNEKSEVVASIEKKLWVKKKS